MSREELVQKFGELIWTQLLAMDREDSDTVAKLITPEIERLLAVEREKVREMCCLAVCEDCVSGYKLLKSSTIQWEHEVPATIRFGNAVFVQCEAYKIRQLDLTAPSSTEE